MTQLAAESLLVRIYCRAGDLEEGMPLHEAVVASARAGGLAGATVLTGKMGYGRHGHVYSDLLEESEAGSQPVVVELVDEPTRVRAYLPALEALVRGRRLITIERAEVLYYRARPLKSEGGNEQPI